MSKPYAPSSIVRVHNPSLSHTHTHLQACTRTQVVFKLAFKETEKKYKDVSRVNGGLRRDQMGASAGMAPLRSLLYIELPCTISVTNHSVAQRSWKATAISLHTIVNSDATRASLHFFHWGQGAFCSLALHLVWLTGLSTHELHLQYRLTKCQSRKTTLLAHLLLLFVLTARAQLRGLRLQLGLQLCVGFLLPLQLTL